MEEKGVKRPAHAQGLQKGHWAWPDQKTGRKKAQGAGRALRSHFERRSHALWGGLWPCYRWGVGRNGRDGWARGGGQHPVERCQ